MGRNKIFDPEQTLVPAMEVFWECGYEGTSMQALVDAMGINRSSLYHTYRDKHALYLAALQRYRSRKEGYLREAMRSITPVQVAFRRVFEAVAEIETQDPARKGCFFVNAMMEKGTLDEEVETLVQDTLEVMVVLFETALQEGKERGELRADADPQQLARYFANAHVGLRAMAKVITDAAYLQDIIDATLAIIEQD